MNDDIIVMANTDWESISLIINPLALPALSPQLNDKSWQSSNHCPPPLPVHLRVEQNKLTQGLPRPVDHAQM